MKTIKIIISTMLAITLIASIKLTIQGKDNTKEYKELREIAGTIMLVDVIIYMADPNPKKKKEKIIQEQDIQRIPENDSENYTTIDI